MSERVRSVGAGVTETVRTAGGVVNIGDDFCSDDGGGVLWSVSVKGVDFGVASEAVGGRVCSLLDGESERGDVVCILD